MSSEESLERKVRPVSELIKCPSKECNKYGTKVICYFIFSECEYLPKKYKEKEPKHCWIANS